MKFAVLLLLLFSFVETAQSQEVVSALPSFEIIDWKGQKLSSSDLKNQVVIIDFWAPWCAPCKKEMPGFQQLQDRYAKQGLIVIGFKAEVMADTEDPIEFAKKLGIRYPLAAGSAQILEKF